MSRVHTAVLCRGFAGAKRRLAPVLAPAERAVLARAMLADVLSALAAAPGIAGIAVVSGDPAVAGFAAARGVVVVDDPAPAGPSTAAALAARAFPEALLVLPADIPLARPGEIVELLTAVARPPAVALAAAAGDGGTNALAAAPSDAIPFAFGERSLARHRALADERGLSPTVLSLPGLGRDLDRPADLAAFLARPSPTRTFAALTRMGVPARLGRAA